MSIIEIAARSPDHSFIRRPRATTNEARMKQNEVDILLVLVYLPIYRRPPQSLGRYDLVGILNPDSMVGIGGLCYFNLLNNFTQAVVTASCFCQSLILFYLGLLFIYRHLNHRCGLVQLNVQ